MLPSTYSITNNDEETISERETVILIIVHVRAWY